MTRGGSIIVVSSIINVKGIPNHGMYGATKAGVRSLVRTWAQELKETGIRVNTLSPGATKTPIIRGQFESDEASDAAKQAFASMTPLSRIGQPEGARRRRTVPCFEQIKLHHRHRPSGGRRPGSGLKIKPAWPPETLPSTKARSRSRQRIGHQLRRP